MTDSLRKRAWVALSAIAAACIQLLASGRLGAKADGLARQLGVRAPPKPEPKPEPISDLLTEAINMGLFNRLPFERRDSFHVRSEYDDLCRYWILKILVELGGHRESLHERHVSEPQMFAFVGLELNRPDKQYCYEDALFALKELHRTATSRPVAWPEGAPALANVAWLRELLMLSSIEERIVLLCVLARCNYPLGQAMEALGALSNLRLISVLCTLLGGTADEITAALRPEGLLTRSGLLRLDNSGHYTFCGKIDLLDGIAERLLVRHGDCLDIFADNFVASPEPALELGHYPHLQPQLDYLVSYMAQTLRARPRGANVLVWGPPGTGKTQLVRAVARALGASLFEVAHSRGEGNRVNGAQRLGSYVLAQRILAARPNTLILFDEIEDIDQAIADDEDEPFSRRERASKSWFNAQLETNPNPAIWVSNRIRQIDEAHRRRFDIHLHVDVPPAPIRTRMLESHVLALGASAKWCERAARHKGLGPALMERTARVAGTVLAERPMAGGEAVLETLLGSSLKALGEEPLGRCAGADSLDYDAAVISASVDPQTLARGLVQSRSGRLLLAGPPGTGKSAYAQYLARELGQPLLVKRGSDLMSPYVGESERLIARAFESARQDGAVLVIDEADTFISSRRNAARNWEVSMVNEFLQQMEAFDQGVFIATTNLIDRLDEASLRRFDAKVTFSYLRAAQAGILMRRACERLGLDPHGCEAPVAGLDRLTPGDFAAVVRQARFNPVRDVSDLAARLREEVRHKGGANRPIGFCVDLREV